MSTKSKGEDEAFLLRLGRDYLTLEGEGGAAEGTPGGLSAAPHVRASKEMGA